MIPCLSCEVMDAPFCTPTISSGLLAATIVPSSYSSAPVASARRVKTGGKTPSPVCFERVCRAGPRIPYSTVLGRSTPRPISRCSTLPAAPSPQLPSQGQDDQLRSLRSSGVKIRGPGLPGRPSPCPPVPDPSVVRLQLRRRCRRCHHARQSSVDSVPGRFAAASAVP